MGQYAQIARIGPLLHDDDALPGGECIARIEVRCCRCGRFVTFCHPSAATIRAEMARTYCCAGCRP